MNSENLTEEQTAMLAALADGIIPPDEMDAGAGAVNAGPRLAAKINAGANAAIYLKGMEAAKSLAMERFRRDVSCLAPPEIEALLGLLRQSSPAFFKQLRLDVAALYLSDSSVQRRIGFPGPSIESGGYPDFAQPQPDS